MRRQIKAIRINGRLVLVTLTLILLGLIFPINAQAQRNLVVGRETSRQDRVETARVEKRIALVIGNNGYRVSRLTASINDARAMAKALKDLNFEVVQLEDVGRLAMHKAIRKFADDLARQDTVGLFYFAGHGVQSNGKNFLVPIDADIEHEDDIELQSVDIQYLLDKFRDIRSGMNILILDACRNNPFARTNVKRSSGLAAVDGPPGTLVAFAAAPGHVATEATDGNGIYTKNILANIRVPGVPIEEVFKRIRTGVLEETKGNQVPWENTSLVRDFYFQAAQSGQGYKPTPMDTESEAWSKIEASRNIYDFIGFLRRFPGTRFELDLLKQINAILAKIKPAPPAILASELPSLLYEAYVGFGMRSLNRYSAEHYGLETTKGVLVTSVERSSSAERAGILPGDILLRVNGAPVEDVNAVVTLGRTILPGEYVEAIVWRNRHEISLPVIIQRISLERLFGRIASVQIQNKDYVRARAYLEYLANIDDAAGQTLLGIFYANGVGVPKDARTAESWLSKAARQGNPLAAASLAQIYLTPSSGIANDSEAFRLAKLSAEAGMPEGAAFLAIAYLRGAGTTKDAVEAVKWSRFAAELGNSRGMFLLGSAYETGFGGLSKSPDDAKAWFRRSRDLNFDPARVALQRLGE
jgi:TPR repeat protein